MPRTKRVDAIQTVDDVSDLDQMFEGPSWDRLSDCVQERTELRARLEEMSDVKGIRGVWAGTIIGHFEVKFEVTTESQQKAVIAGIEEFDNWLHDICRKGAVKVWID